MMYLKKNKSLMESKQQLMSVCVCGVVCACVCRYVNIIQPLIRNRMLIYTRMWMNVKMNMFKV